MKNIFENKQKLFECEDKIREAIKLILISISITLRYKLRDDIENYSNKLELLIVRLFSYQKDISSLSYNYENDYKTDIYKEQLNFLYSTYSKFLLDYKNSDYFKNNIYEVLEEIKLLLESAAGYEEIKKGGKE